MVIQPKAANRLVKRMNKGWRAANPMPVKASLEQRIAWHWVHTQHCGCRPIPASLRKLIPG
jgi:hypothetical protein